VLTDGDGVPRQRPHSHTAGAPGVQEKRKDVVDFYLFLAAALVVLPGGAAALPPARPPHHPPPQVVPIAGHSK
jgi:hypothetical protein